MCGIVGLVAHEEVKQDLYDALTALQHRGQDAAGIVTSDGQRCFLRKHNGLVGDVFREEHMARLQGHVDTKCRLPLWPGERHPWETHRHCVRARGRWLFPRSHCH